MKISTAELKRFKSNSSSIKTNTMLPVLSYLKFDDGKVIKNSLDSFIVQDMDFKGSMLVEENELFIFLNGTNEPIIDISQKENRVIISDSNGKSAHAAIDMAHFPALSVPDSKKIELSTDALCAISFAANFVDEMEFPDMRSHVFVGNNLVAGCNGFIGYSEKVKEKTPQIVLPKDVANSIGKLSDASFMENDKYIFLETSGSLYGFIKPTYPFFDEKAIFALDKKETSFMVNKNDMIPFCERCVASVKTLGRISKMTMKGKKLFLSMTDSGFEKDHEQLVNIEGTMDGEFKFNPSLMNTLLKNLPDKELTLYKTAKGFHVTGESGFISMIQGLA